jgi:hypothetical protein
MPPNRRAKPRRVRDVAIDILEHKAQPRRSTTAAIRAANPDDPDIADAIAALHQGAHTVHLDFGAGGRVTLRSVEPEEEGPDLFGATGPLPALRPTPPPTTTDDLTAAAEARAFHSGRPLSQERAELLARHLPPVAADTIPALAIFSGSSGVRRPKVRTSAKTPKARRRPA